MGAWPLDRERAVAYMIKAARECKSHTSWSHPDAGYEAALTGFVGATLADQRFTEILQGFVTPLVAPGRQNALAQTLIKLTAPGVPDLYQGSELWDLSLVDPDNRRPIDYELRRRLLADLADASPELVLARADDGLPKLWVVRQALGLRRRCPAPFQAGEGYTPISAQGPRADHLVGFVRGDAVATLVPRWPLRLAGDWAGSAVVLPAGRWRNQLTGEVLAGGRQAVAEVFARFPVALLAREEVQ